MTMKLVAIYNVFDGEELLKDSVMQIRHHCDGVLAVVQRISNMGNPYDGGLEICDDLKAQGIIDAIAEYNPDLSAPAIQNELMKRNSSVDLAKRYGFTHFLLMDCDEFYRSDQFAACKAAIEENGWEATVSPIQSYFKTPTLTIGLDCYHVPFIHRLRPDTCLNNRDYPYTVDPTRSVQLPHGTTIHSFAPEELTMHHYTWVRKDILRKVENSSCREYITNNSTLLQDYQNATDGYHVAHYNKTLSLCEDIFGINGIC